MVNPQLLEYVRAQRASGLSKEAIVQAAAPGGWTPADIDEVYAAQDGVQKPQIPTPPPPRVFTPPPQPVAAPLVPRPTPRPVVSPTEITTAPAQKSRKGFYIALGIVVGVCAFAAVGYFIVWPFVQESLKAITPTEIETTPLPPPPQLEVTPPEETASSTSPATSTPAEAIESSSSTPAQ